MSEEIVSGNAPIEPRRLIAKSEWARLRGVSPCYVSKLLKERKIVDVQGKIDSVEADRCLEASRLRVQNGHSNAGAIKQLKNAELEAKNEWRGPVLLYVDGKEHVVPIDVARCAFDLANPTEKDTLRVASILRSAGWRQRALQVGRKRGLVYVKPGWTPHKPQRTPLAEAILDLRNHFGEKQSGFAVRLGLTVTSVAKYETWGLPKRQVLGRLKQIAKEAGRDDLVAAFSAVRGVRQQDDCAVEDCQQERRSGSRYCRLHDLEKERAALKTRWATDREFRQKRRKYRLDGREKHNARVKQRRIEDEVFRNRVAYLKRAASFRSRIADRCTEAYLKAAKQEDETLTSALSAWIKSFRKRKTREERAEIARKNAQDKYWQDPEAEKRRVQAYKHSRPDYRKRWNGERGAREAACSDGTLTKESVGALFAASKLCPYCGDPYKKSRRSLDHIVPLAKANGRKLHSITNVLVCCRSCNCRKHAKGLTQFLEEVKAAKRKNALGSTVSNAIPSLFECLAN